MLRSKFKQLQNLKKPNKCNLICPVVSTAYLVQVCDMLKHMVHCLGYVKPSDGGDYMTDIQVKYWDYKEGARHNLANEGETNRHNVRTEQQQDVALVETNRHNVASENENVRHNVTTEGETNRHNVASEGIQSRMADASEQQASAALQNAASNTKNASTNALKAASDIELNKAKGRLNQANASAKELENSYNKDMFYANQAIDVFGGIVAPILGGLKNVDNRSLNREPKF